MSRDHQPTGFHGVYVSHPGFIDRFIREWPRPEERPSEYPDAWIVYSERDEDDHRARFATLAEAKAHAEKLQNRYGAKGYTFVPVEEVLVPRWRIAEPMDDWESRDFVGAAEQIPLSRKRRKG